MKHEGQVLHVVAVGIAEAGIGAYLGQPVDPNLDAGLLAELPDQRLAGLLAGSRMPAGSDQRPSSDRLTSSTRCSASITTPTTPIRSSGR